MSTLGYWKARALQIEEAYNGVCATAELQRGFMVACNFWCIDELAKVIDTETAARIEAETALEEAQDNHAVHHGGKND